MGESSGLGYDNRFQHILYQIQLYIHTQTAYVVSGQGRNITIRNSTIEGQSYIHNESSGQEGSI